MSAPIVSNVKRHAGIAGQFSVSASVQYEGEEASTVTFVGSVYGPPIVMVTPDGHQIFVSSRVTERIGSELDEAWVRAFFAPSFVVCSWCGSEATHQLDSTTGDQCCATHYARYFGAKAGA